jgi:hypothetical protein
MDIIALLNSDDADEYYFTPSMKMEKQENIDLLEKTFATNLPLDYKTILLKFGPCSIEGQNSLIYMISIDDMFHRLGKTFQKELKSALVIGSDGGGSYYFYDTDNSLGKGINSIYIADRGLPTPEYSDFVANSFTDLVLSIQNR